MYTGKVYKSVEDEYGILCNSIYERSMHIEGDEQCRYIDDNGVEYENLSSDCGAEDIWVTREHMLAMLDILLAGGVDPIREALDHKMDYG